MQIQVEWKFEDIKKRRPTWDDGQIFEFLTHTKTQLEDTAKKAGDTLIDILLPPEY